MRTSDFYAQSQAQSTVAFIELDHHGLVKDKFFSLTQFDEDYNCHQEINRTIFKGLMWKISNIKLHLAGWLGAALCYRFDELGWIERLRGGGGEPSG